MTLTSRFPCIPAFLVRAGGLDLEGNSDGIYCVARLNNKDQRRSSRKLDTSRMTLRYLLRIFFNTLAMLSRQISFALDKGRRCEKTMSSQEKTSRIVVRKKISHPHDSLL